MATQTKKRKSTFMPGMVFEPSIPVFEGVKIFRALGRAANMFLMKYNILILW